MKPTTVGARRVLALGAAGSLAAGLAPVLLASPAQAADEVTAPKNVIVLISDGAGYNQFDAARAYETGATYQQATVDPATGAITHADGTPSQVYDEFPVQVGQAHYSASGRADYVPADAWGDFDWVASGATDSAAAATALGTGVKTNNGTIGYDPEANELLTVGQQAQEVGKKVGLVTSVTFNHATPAGFIAHNSDRNDYHGLATEIIDSGIDVVIGAGHPNYTDANRSRSSNFGDGSWISQADFERVAGGETPFSYVESRADFEEIAAGENVPDKLFGLARVAETFQYNRPGLENDEVLPYTDPLNRDVPSLATSSQAALNVLETDEDGFFLMIEGGAVDWAGHANQTTRVVEEQIDFNDSVEAVTQWVEENSSWDETLVVVTADHETGYLTGPGADAETGWTELTGAAGELPDVDWHSGGHTNALVPLYAKGAGSEILQARSTSWDPVRGAYLDNTDIGETVFDLLGHPAAGGGSTVGLESTVPLPQGAGALTLTIPDAEQTVELAGAGTQEAALPEVVVADSRTDAAARGDGWTVSGSASDFTAGNRTFGADNLSWTPAIVSSESGAAAGGTATLEAPAALADADGETRSGTTVVGAGLALSVPEEARGGVYASQVTLTLFPKD